MQWTHHPGMSFADGGAAALEGDDGWEAYPFGVHEGAPGLHPTREAAIDAAEAVAIGTYCCSGEAPESCG